MRLSAARKQRLYDAIHEPVIQARIRLSRNPQQGAALDAEIAKLTEAIFNEALKALTAEEPRP
jgi:hypothetical protein